MQIKTRKAVLGTLVATVVALNLFVSGLLLYALDASKDRKEHEVRTTVENLALLLDQSVTGSVREIDLSLREIQAQLEHELTSDRLSDTTRYATVVASHENWLMDAAEIRITDARGRVVQGTGVLAATRDGYADRPFFERHRLQPDAGMQASKLLLSRGDSAWVNVFSRRYNHPDGSFAGVIVAAMHARHFEKMLTGLKLGPRGIALMRDLDKTLIARVPALDAPAGRVGARGGSQEVTDIIASGVKEATFYSAGTADGINRIDAYRRLSLMPAFVVVGLGEDDYLAEWHADVRKAVLLLVLFLIFTVAVVSVLWRLIQENERVNRRSQILLQNASDGIHILDLHGHVLEASEAFCRMLGAQRDEVIGESIAHWEAMQTERQLRDKIQEMHAQGGLRVFETMHRRKDGTRYPVEISACALMLEDTPVLVCSARDITGRKKAADDLLIAASAFQSQVAMLITDDHQVIIRVNPAFSAVTGYTPEEVIGQTPRMFSSGRHDVSFYKSMWESLNRTGSWQGEIWNRRKGGEVYPQAISIGAVKNESGKITHYVSTFVDITSSKMSEEQVHQLAFYDPLTHLPNRRLLLDRLEQAMGVCAQEKTRGALLFVDLDNFKSVNDTAGHYEGDLLLEQVSRILRSCVRDEDTVARLGSDEFVVMLVDLSAFDIEAARRAELIGSQMLKALHRTFQLGSTEHRCTASIGVTLFGDTPHEGVDEPLKRADLAMYQSKLAGGNTLCFFDPKMQADIQARAELNAGLWAALDHQQFFLQYQPQVSAGRCITGVEALVRWRHPERGLVSPAAFIPVAEQNGLIVPLGRWVMETACVQLAQWALDPRTASLTIAVNVSARQFGQDSFVADVLDILKRTGANPARLELELTESSLVTDVESVIQKMDALKTRGVSFSLDDFGTGYSSLAYLKRLPLNKLKIDQGFVRDILNDPNDAAIARTVIVLAESMGLSVIAEGVETEAQCAFLAEQGCQAYQGYLFSRPLNIDDLENFLQDWQT